MHKTHPYIKFNAFEVVKYTKPTDDKLEENEFTFRLMTRQYNGAHDLDMLKSELVTRLQEQEMNQSGWSMQRFDLLVYILHHIIPVELVTIINQNTLMRENYQMELHLHMIIIT